MSQPATSARSVTLKRYPGARETQRDDFEIVSSPLPEQLPPGHVLLQVLYLSVDPAQRIRMHPGQTGYFPPFELGKPLDSYGIARVVASTSSSYAVGQLVSAFLPAVDYRLAHEKELQARSFHRSISPEIPLPLYMGVLGLTGLTAYFGLTEVGRIKAGETVLVTGAAGATGSAAVQIAKALGCRVVGVAGGPEKVRFVREELGADAAIDYRPLGSDEGAISAALREACPGGVDVHFDNVGGAFADAAIGSLNQGGRVVMCGQISDYNAFGEPSSRYGYKNLAKLIFKRGSITGFLVSDYIAKWGEGVERLAALQREGKLRQRDTVLEGLDRYPDASDERRAREGDGGIQPHWVVTLAS
eukprot:tig00020807_g14070.t1